MIAETLNYRNLEMALQGKTGIALSRLWHLADAQGQILGHFCRGVATTLMGQHKPVYDQSRDFGDYVVVVNAKDIVVSGEKRQQKMYRHHTGYPGGLKETPFWRMQQERPEEIVRRGVYGMLPKNDLRRRQMRRLLIFPGKEHPYQANLTKLYEDPDLHVITPRQWADMSAEEMLVMHEQVQMTKLQRLFPGISL